MTKRGYIDYLGFMIGVGTFVCVIFVIIVGTIWNMVDKIKDIRRKKKGQKQ